MPLGSSRLVVPLPFERQNTTRPSLAFRPLRLHFSKHVSRFLSDSLTLHSRPRPLRLKPEALPFRYRCDCLDVNYSDSRQLQHSPLGTMLVSFTNRSQLIPTSDRWDQGIQPCTAMACIVMPIPRWTAYVAIVLFASCDTLYLTGVTFVSTVAIPDTFVFRPIGLISGILWAM